MKIEEFAIAVDRLGDKNSRVFYYPPARITITKNELLKRVEKITIQCVSENLNDEETRKRINQLLEYYVVIDSYTKSKAKKVLKSLLSVKK